MRTRTTLFALALVVLVTGSALAQAGHTGGCTCGQFATKPIPFQIEHSSVAYQDAAMAEFNRWNDVANLVTAAIGDGLADSPNGKNEILFVQDTLTSDTFGLALILPASAFSGNPPFDDCANKTGSTICGTFTEADVLINSDFVRGFTPVGPPDFDDDNGPAYYGTTALHEIGHALGLHHNFRNLSTMNYVEDYAGQYVGIADAAALRAAYPVQVKSMTDIGTYPFRYDPAKQQYAATTPVSFSPGSVTAGVDTITVTNATVENVGNVSLNNVKIEFYLSTDSTITTSDILLGSFTYSGAFPSGGYDDEPFPDIPIPASVPGGSYFVGARILQNAATADGISYNNTWASPGQLSVTGGTTSNGCPNSSTDLILQNGQFRTSLCAKDPRTGATGQGVATAFNSIVGYYSIPSLTGDPNNFEVFVKVLDGRPINGKFWVFYGGLTDFELTITVTDTTTGAKKTYTRAGTELGGGADTNAF
ncbi:MAG: hypothetical protein ACSLFQ_21245 [Thermoanaerobaculia bacterium]